MREHSTQVKGRFDFLHSRVVYVAAYTSNRSELTLGVTPILFHNFTGTIVDTEGLSVQRVRVRWLSFEKKKSLTRAFEHNFKEEKIKPNSSICCWRYQIGRHL